MRGVAAEPLALGRAATQPGQVGLCRRIVDEDQPGRVESALVAPPEPARFRDVGAVLFGRMERLFLYVRPSRASTQWIAPMVQLSASRSLISASVKSGSCCTNAFNRAPCSGSSFALRPQNRYRARRSPVRLCCVSNFFTIPTETLNRRATSSLVPSSASYAAYNFI